MRTYLRQRRQRLWWLTALALFFAAYFALRTDRTAMNRLCGSVIFPAMRQVARLCDGFDGSVGEVLILTAIWAGIIWLACTVRRLIAGPRRRAVLADFVLTAACLMLTVYGGFCLLWGTAYSTDSFQDRSGIVAQPVSVEELEQVVSLEEIEQLKSMIPQISMSDEVAGYLMDIVEHTRNSGHFVLGVSTRGAIALYKASQVTAALAGRDYVLPEDVRYVAPYVLCHRVTFNGPARTGDIEETFSRLLAEVPAPLENIRQ